MKLLLSDDHHLFLEGTSAILRSFIDGVDIDTTDNGIDAHKMVLSNAYDAVILDLRLPGINGFKLLKKLRNEDHPVPPILILTASDNPADAQHAIELGARAFISKTCSGQSIVAFLQRVLSGETIEAVNEKQLAPDQKNTGWAAQHKITPRQLEVLRLLRLGLSNQAIADRLHISLATAKSHISALFQAFDAKTRSEAVDKAQMLGLG